jgi:predicted house-cleaning noncanonical NTP pyrophosphatase (MazG superfamily)
VEAITVTEGKLVPDRVPEIIRSTRRTAEVRVLNGDELLEALLAKLEEETDELRTAPVGERIDELADVLEVVRALAGKFGIEDGPRAREQAGGCAG